jgi:hypothetical protein
MGRASGWLELLVGLSVAASSACGGSTTQGGGPSSGDAGDASTQDAPAPAPDASAGDAPAIDAASGDAAACGAPVVPGGACNALAPIAAPIVPTCTSGTVPTGTGGIIVPGTYALTQQVYFNLTTCGSEPVSGTYAFLDGCIQGVAQVDFRSDAGPATYRVNESFTQPAPNEITSTTTCISPPLNGTLDAPLHTFTATPTTFTLFIHNSAVGNSNPDRVEVFTKL